MTVFPVFPSPTSYTSFPNTHTEYSAAECVSTRLSGVRLTRYKYDFIFFPVGNGANGKVEIYRNVSNSRPVRSAFTERHTFAHMQGGSLSSVWASLLLTHSHVAANETWCLKPQPAIRPRGSHSLEQKTERNNKPGRGAAMSLGK